MAGPFDLFGQITPTSTSNTTTTSLLNTATKPAQPSVYNGNGQMLPTSLPTFGNPAAPTAMPVFYKPSAGSQQVVDRNGTPISSQQYQQLTGQTNVDPNQLNWSYVKNFAPPGYVQPATPQAPPAPVNTNYSNGYAPLAPAVQTAPPTPFTADVPSTTTSSSNMQGDTTSAAIMQSIADQHAKAEQALSGLGQFASVPQSEMDQQQKVASDQAQVTAAQGQAAGIYNPSNQATTLPFLTGGGMNKLMSAQLQQQIDSTNLNYMAGNREFAFNSASKIYDASRNNVNDMLNIYAQTAPQNLSTNYNPTTGQVTGIMRNPLSGAQYTADLGNIGAQHTFTSTNITTDPLTGALTFVGTTSDGQVITRPVGGGSSLGNSGTASTTSGYSAGTPQPGVSTLSNLLGNWVNGGTATPASAGYQSSVYQTASKLAGVQLGADTPASVLSQYIPQITQGIATAEGWNNPNSSQHTLNNPGNIIWANQPNATPEVVQTSSGPRTFAKFDTLENGWNAMSNLVAHKLGASPMPQATQAVAQTIGQGQAPSMQQLHQVVQELPQQLQNSVKYLPNGQPYFDGAQLNAQQQTMAGYYSGLGIPYINADDASSLKSITTTQNSLQQFGQLADQTLRSGFVGKATNWLTAGVGNIFGGTTLTNFNANRTTALSAIEGLAGGTGSGFRLTTGEINTAVANLPTISDSKEQADAKLQILNTLLNNKISTVIPSYRPSGASTGSGVDYTATLNNLMGK